VGRGPAGRDEGRRGTGGHISAPVIGEAEARVQPRGGGNEDFCRSRDCGGARSHERACADRDIELFANFASDKLGGPDYRITTTFRIAVATKDTESMNDVKAQETGRRTLYGMAAGECPILTEMFKAECRLNNFTITSLASPPSNLPTSMMGASAVYELKPGGQASGR
jgi:hypothetical protein